ncbi:MAG: DUF2071 domain-containing protein [Bacteroidota bacterium]
MDTIQKIFLTAEWKNLIMANYAVDPIVLQTYLPAHTELDSFNGKYYVSLVGFMFEKVKIKSISIPFHTNFPEINLRFYVKLTDKDGSVKRGVVFISEIVPKAAIAWVANNIYREKYVATAMKHSVLLSDKALELTYSWYWKGKDNLISANAANQLWPIEPGTAEAFIFEHYFGFAKVNDATTNMYTVEHPTWNTYPVHSYKIDCNFQNFYGSEFSFLDNAIPDSVFIAAGSAVVIRDKTVLKKK